MLDIKSIESYYNIQYNNIKRLISKDKNYHFEFLYTDNNKHIVDIYDIKKNKKKLVLKAEYEILGCYNAICSIWTWGWAMSMVEKNLTESSRKIRNFSDKLEGSKRITSNIEKYIYYCKNPTFYLSNKNLNEIYKLGIYATKSIWMIPRKIENMKSGIIEIILLKKILQEKN